MTCLIKMLAPVIALTAIQLSAMEVAVMPSFNEERLRATAETIGHGYKFANLDELRFLTVWFNAQPGMPLKVEVPQFFGIASGRIEALLRDAGFDAVAQWAEVVGTVPEGDREEIMRTKLLPESFWEAQRSFVARLETAFDALIPGLAGREFEEFATPPGAGQLGATALIEQTRISGDNFMVRSTGKEDTRTMANAGGNESIPSVAADKHALWDAIKKVVISYFGEKSLCQRLGLGDPTIFEPAIFCPVLVQRMIGEWTAASSSEEKGPQPSSEIPRCGVMFTEEPEGGISCRDEKDERGRVKTTGITLIQAALGHNEGVVNSKVVVDTYVAQNIAGEAVFYPTIRAKKSRLAPGADGKLGMKRNSQKQALDPALTYEMLETLKKFADALEWYYGYPIDAEFVVRDNTIWIVQARPIVHKEELKTREPSYLNLAAVVRESMVLGRTIVGFGGQVVRVSSKAECIINSKIGAALDQYLYHTDDKEAVVAVLSGSDVPGTSHEATMFRNQGKLVLYVPEVAKLQEALRQGKELWISPQQHCVVIVDAGADMVPTAGWCAYPLPRELSLVDSLYKKDEGAVSADSLPALSGAKLDLKASFVRICSSDQEVARAAAEEFPALVRASLEQWAAKDSVTKVKLDADLIVQSKRILKVTKFLCDWIGKLIEAAAPRLAVLLPIRYLEATIFQQTPGERDLRYLSLVRLRSIYEKEKEVAGGAGEKVPLGAASAHHRQLKKMDSVIFEAQTQGSWNHLLEGIYGNRAAEETLGALIGKLAELEILPFWLHVVMRQDVQALGVAATSGDFAGLIKKWVSNYEGVAASFGEIKNLREQVVDFNVGRFADPKEYDGAWAELQRLQAEFNAAKFTDMLRQDGLVLIAAVDVLQKFVNLYDLSIKAGCVIWKDDERPVRFQKMLQGFLGLLENLVATMPKDKQRLLEAKESTIEEYQAMIHQLVDQEPLPEYLKPSEGLDAVPFAMGAGHDWVKDRNFNRQPKTGEDGYTITHTSLVNLCVLLMGTPEVESLEMPPLLASIEEIVTTAFKKEISERFLPARLIGTMFNKTGIVRAYNIPLGSHGIQVVLQYCKKTNNVRVEINCFGGLPDEFYRWANMAALFGVFYAGKAFDGRIVKLGVHAVSLEIVVVPESLENFRKYFIVIPHVIKTFATDSLHELLALQAEGFGGIHFNEQRINNVHHSLSIEESTNGKALLAFFEQLAQQGYSSGERGFAEVVAAAQAGIRSADVGMRVSALTLFKALVDRERGFAEAIAAAQAGFRSLDVDVRVNALKLFKELFEKGKGFAEAIEAAQVGVMSVDAEVRVSALVLFGELFKKGQGFAEAIAAAKKGVMSANADVRFSGLKLLKVLFDKSQGFAEAIAVAQAGVMSADVEVRVRALVLFEELFKRRQGFAEAIVVAQVGVMSVDAGVRVSALELFRELFKKRQGFAEAIAAVSAAIARGESSNMVDLCDLLLFCEIGLTEVAACARAAFSHENSKVVESAINLFKQLFKKFEKLHGVSALAEKEKIVEQALLAVRDNINTTNPPARQGLFVLIEWLIKRDINFAEGPIFAKNLVASENSLEICNGLRLYIELVQKDKLFDEALAQLKIALKSDNETSQHLAWHLLGWLVEKGQFFDEALFLIRPFITTADGKADSPPAFFYVLCALVEKGVGFVEAIGWAKKFFPNDMMQSDVNTLFEKLFLWKQGFDAAEEIIIVNIDSEDDYIQESAVELLKQLLVQSKKIDFGMQQHKKLIDKDKPLLADELKQVILSIKSDAFLS
jgi:tetratricopeptide (TPR) repeat protein